MIETRMDGNAKQPENANMDTQSHEDSGTLSCHATPAYSKMELSASLPPPLQRPNLGPWITGREDPFPTFHQLLLVLNYLFITAMLPKDDATIQCIIYRHSADWESAFVLQYNGLLSWLASTRDALTDAHCLHTISLDDLESQIRWILFMLGRYSLPGSSVLQASFQSEEYPYRPFGVRAGMALVCLAFAGIQPKDIQGYEWKQIWPCGEQFYAIMASRLKGSPLFENDICVFQLEAMVRRLHQAFHLEEVHVALTRPHRICIDNDVSTEEYYRQAFLSLHPALLPRVCEMLQEPISTTEVSAHHLADICAKTFQKAPSVDVLESAFTSMPEILNSKADRTVVIEMFHVRLSQQLNQLNSGKS
ncbi:hypothetical protein N7478_000786 [Penicillium angulare]|uniref:uncharacterized protein n=1 Tax=Penicillium angulare TaxID=116970 RepID=UPI00253FB753|nr:uncharacterized protein N7478_000786 [Penicillium angulare]KAJ5291535.1 hypothetical protein N7478_000786 [Penicillium angulare]